MPRIKLRENSAKKIIAENTGLSYDGIFIDENANLHEAIKNISAEKKYVVKVDQGVNKRERIFRFPN